MWSYIGGMGAPMFATLLCIERYFAIGCRTSGKSKPGPEVIKLFPFSTQLSTKFVLLINVKMPTIVGILTFISRINITSERLKAIILHMLIF